MKEVTFLMYGRIIMGTTLINEIVRKYAPASIGISVGTLYLILKSSRKIWYTERKYQDILYTNQQRNNIATVEDMT